jgi:replicative DNA helicase
MIYSFDLEKKVLSGILQHQHKWEEISSFINESDFYSEDSKVNVSIFKLLKNALDNAENIDETILVQRIGRSTQAAKRSRHLLRMQILILSMENLLNSLINCIIKT